MNASDREQLHDRLVDAFNRSELEQVVRFHLGSRLEVLVNTEADFSQIVHQLLESQERRGTLLSLIRGVVRARPDREDLIAFCRAIAPEALAETKKANLVHAVTSGLTALSNSQVLAQLGGKAGELRVLFRQIDRQIAVLDRYKRLHDGLHNLQMRISFIEASSAVFTASAVHGKLLRLEAINLREHSRRAAEYAQPLPTRTLELYWIEDLERAGTEISEALKEKDAVRMERAVLSLRRVLQETYRIDGQLTSAAGALQLPDLIEALSEIARFFDEEPAATTAQIDCARDALRVLHPELDALVAQHNEWQWLNRELGGVESNPGFRPEDKIPRWPRVKTQLKELCDVFQSSDWSANLLQQIEEWEQAALTNQEELAEQTAVSVYAVAMNRFFDVDLELLDLCDELTEIGVPLQSLFNESTP